MIFGSQIGQIAHPFYVAFGYALAGFYSLIPNYAVAISLLTIAVMILVFPITRRGTRSMMKMQLLAPEVKKLQTRYKAQPGMSVQERQDLRQRMNDELMALYKANDASPTGGCLPMFLQFPIFILLYGTVRGLTHEVKTKSGELIVQPLYIPKNSKMYDDIQAAHGELNSFGINLADSVRTPGLHWGPKVVIIVMILIAIALQYIQMKQLSGRNPAAAAANPQMQQMQKFMPLIFAVIYISIPAAVTTYFIVSSLFRIGQQEYMYRRDPQLQASVASLRDRAGPAAKTTDVEPASPARKSRWPFAKGGDPPLEPAQQPRGPAYTPPRSELNNSKNVSRNGGKSQGKPSTNGSSDTTKAQPRAQGKRQRRQR